MTLTFEDMEATLRGGGVKAVSAPQLFPTPAPLAARMVSLAQLAPGATVLEPSAGTGAILAALPENVSVTAVEINTELARGLRVGQRRLLCRDFLECLWDRPGNYFPKHYHHLGTFDAVIANPPFTKGQDIEHIRHMWQFLKPGGRLVTLASSSWTFNGQKKHAAFREWIEEIDATHEDLPAGTFDGTGVRATLITARKE